MRAPDAFSELCGHFRQVTALSQVSGLLSWDQETMMPERGAELRSEQCAAVEACIHRLRADPRIPDWAAAIDPKTLDPAGCVTLREAVRAHRRATRIPAALAEEIARVTALSQGIWARARAARRFADFAPSLGRIVALRREEADCIAEPGQSRYDALLEDYEPGMTTAVLSPLLTGMRPRLTALAERVAHSGHVAPRLEGSFPKAAQMELARRVATTLGYDWSAGRLDLSVHPFSSGTGGDARITTRVVETDPLNCLYSTIHEVGHACYEQGINPALLLSPAGRWASMGVHESQSRLFENQIGRSRAFCEWLYPQMRAVYGDIGVTGPDALHAAVNRVETGFIRTEADEVHYNLHILLRFELEQALISGALAVEDLEEAWNAAFLRDFHRPVTDPADGVLQDVHWSVGLFGYFPTYSLGNILAGELFAALRAAVPTLEADLARGDAGPALGWLRRNVHVHGSLKPPMQLVEDATGHAPQAGALLGYLEAKFAGLYGL
ncbi:carboxypeptidase M32 [Oceanicella sp. SM1341]|uniref:carboxypeptidase M32 n=1 Tax=Oceanicella sp. SM1341 TaxID=1548889 RepID=UPI000E5538B4|nr:carboxypeptidase M32 [Oceanicella sp. SM1341]